MFMASIRNDTFKMCDDSFKTLLLDIEKNLANLYTNYSHMGNKIDEYIDQFHLPLLKQLKPTIKGLMTDNPDLAPTKQLLNEQLRDYSVNDSLLSDNVSVDAVSYKTPKTCMTLATVSSLRPPIHVDDPLIAIMGVGKYDKNVAKDLEEYDEFAVSQMFKSINILTESQGVTSIDKFSSTIENQLKVSVIGSSGVGNLLS